MKITAIALIAATATAVSHMGWSGDEHERDMTGFKGKSDRRMHHGEGYSKPVEVIEVAIDEEVIEVVVDNADDLDIDMDEIIEAAIEVAIVEDVAEVEVVVEVVEDEEGNLSA